MRLPDGRVLLLPLRALPDGDRAVASLIANQASFEVVAALAAAQADLARAAGADVIVGLPTWGPCARLAAPANLEHQRYVPLA